LSLATPVMMAVPDFELESKDRSEREGGPGIGAVANVE
jgi:hypothetical protein